MPGEFTMTRRVQFAETDLAGVLHFSNYYRYMEELEHAFWRSLGESVVFGDGDGTVSWPRVATSCEYAAPVHFEDELELSLVLTKIGSKSVTYEIAFRRGSDRIAVGEMTAVCCMMSGGRFASSAIPDGIRAKLEGFAAG